MYGNFSRGTCDAGWINYGDTCYLFALYSRASHGGALAACRSKGGILVSPNTAKKQDFLVKYLMRYQPSFGTPIWIGLYQKTSSDPFRWEDGNKLTYANWGCGEPNNAGGGEDCAAMGVGSGNFQSSKWNDDGCSKSFAYVCQKSAPVRKCCFISFSFYFRLSFFPCSLSLCLSIPPSLSANCCLHLNRLKQFINPCTFLSPDIQKSIASFE